MLHCDNGFDYWGKGTMVTVSSAAAAAATAPTVFPLVQCGSGVGDTVTLGCLATGFTPADLTFKWKDASGVVLSEQPTSGFVEYPVVQKGDKYMRVSQIRVNREDWQNKKVFKCAATHSTGDPIEVTLERPVVYHQLPTLEVLISTAEDVKEQDKASFSCSATGFSPKDYKIIWQRNDKELISEYGEIRTKEEKTENGTLYSAVSYLHMNQSDWIDGTPVTCVFEGGAGDVNKSVTYKKAGGGGLSCEDEMMKMKILPLSIEALFHNKPAQLVCEVLEVVKGVESVTWEDMEGNPLANARERREGKKIIVAVDVMYEEWNKGIEYNCIAHHKEALAPKEMRFERSNDGRIDRPLVFLLPPVEQTSMVTLTCYVKDFYPKEAVVSWLINDEPVETLDRNEYVYHTTNLREYRVDSKQFYSVYGQLTFSNATWGNPETVYSCVVYHESMVNTTRVIVRSMVQRTADKPNLVNLSMNIPETCKA